MVLRPGESCTYPGTSHTLTINPDGTASFLSATVGSSINITSGNISLTATRQSDGSWRIERVGASSGGEGAATFRERDRIPDFPTRAPDVVIGGSVSTSGGVVTITLQRDGYVEYLERPGAQVQLWVEGAGSLRQDGYVKYSEHGYRYTCDASECGIRGGLVIAGVIVRAAAGGLTANLAPQTVGSIPDQTITEGLDVLGVVVLPYFFDPDDDDLNYRATSSRTSVVEVSVHPGGLVSLHRGDPGMATVTVTATDPGGLSATQRFAVTVEAEAAGGGVCRNSRATPSGSSAALVRDCGILLEARDELRGTASLNWSADRNIGSWDGVASSPDGVTWVTLDSHGLNGTIPTSLGNLANLRSLSLHGNSLTGTIPGSLGNLANLDFLGMCYTDLTGAIPSALGNLANLRSLFLCESNLTGTIPDSLGNLTNLLHLALDTNDLTGTIPPALGNLTNLRQLSLRNNGLTGAVPDALRNLANLEFLALDHNRLTGAIPDWLGSLANLEDLDLRSNGLTGAIPDSLGNLSLQSLYLNRNRLTGCIPERLAEFVSNINPQQGGVQLDVCGAGNQAPRAVGSIPDQTLTEDGSATTVNVSARFSDPDGDSLSYRATSSRTSVVEVSVSGSRLTLTPGDAGTATVTVTATDPGDLSATQRFTVTVTGSGGGEPADPWTGELTRCEPTLIGTNLYRINMVGVIRAHRDLLLVTLTGYANETLVGVDLLGPLNAGESENFEISGVVTLTPGPLRCRVSIEATYRGQAGIRVQSALPPVETQLPRN